MSEKKRKRRGAVMFSTEDSLDFVTAAMIQTDMLHTWDDGDGFDGKRRRSSGLNPSTRKTSDGTPRLTKSETDGTVPVLILQDSGNSCSKDSSFCLQENLSTCAKKSVWQSGHTRSGKIFANISED